MTSAFVTCGWARSLRYLLYPGWQRRDEQLQSND